ncbi:hypothetical protein X769_32655 [Mesorhizobium sp. LSJC268A00]|nr:hypothetical protein X769_32655 [Mesorhizobium sp. LSJC268A00]
MSEDARRSKGVAIATSGRAILVRMKSVSPSAEFSEKQFREKLSLLPGRIEQFHDGSMAGFRPRLRHWRAVVGQAEFVACGLIEQVYIERLPRRAGASARLRPTTHRGLASCTLTSSPDQAVTQPTPPGASAIAATAIEEVSAREREHAAQAKQASDISRS